MTASFLLAVSAAALHISPPPPVPLSHRRAPRAVCSYLETREIDDVSAPRLVESFWEQIVRVQHSAVSSSVALPLPPQPDSAIDGGLVLEYMQACALHCGYKSDTCDVAAWYEPDASAIKVDCMVGTMAALAAVENAAATPSEAVQQQMRTAALESLMDWFTALLVATQDPSGYHDEEAEDAAFVDLGRSLLHTKAAKVSFGATLGEVHRDLWHLVASAPFLRDGGGGGILFVAPSFNNCDGFDDFVNLVACGLRHLVDPRLKLRSFHPLHASPSRRAPTPALHVFLDAEHLCIADGGGDERIPLL